jgi:DNA-binding transcriptional LysR family regulator
MTEMNWGAFDLNLLIVFDAVMHERSVTRAGSRIGMSQPAVSHALNRLRYQLKDELFVRTPAGMVPTPRAEQIALPLRQALSEMQRVLEPEEFIPGTSDRHFTLSVNNYAAVVLAPPLVAAVASDAPDIRLDIRPSGTINIADQLDSGELDLAIGSSDVPGERFADRLLVRDSFVVVMRPDHPAARTRLSAKAFAALPHLEISSSGDDTSFIDRFLAEQGLSRHITLRVPYLSAARILAQSDIVATLSRRIAEAFVRTNNLLIRKPPYDSPIVETRLLWHRRLDDNPGHRWLRDIAARVSKTL